MRTRRPWVVFGLAAVVVTLGAAWAMEHRRHRVALELADRDMAAGRYGAACQRLAELSTRWIRIDEVNYRLGLCEEALGHDEAALEAWARVPVHSSRAEEAAMNSATLEMRKGRLSAAEPILVRALGRPGPQVVKLCRLLCRLYWEEGRTDDMRTAIETSWKHVSQPGWLRPEEALDLLRDHIAVDYESLAITAFKTVLDYANQRAPEDDRVWLAQANLAIQTGEFAAARRRLDDCLARRAEDPAVWQAMLDCAMGAEDVAQIRHVLAHLSAERFSLGRIEALRAWLAARRGASVAERQALEQVVQLDPGNCAAWERLAVLAAQSGRGDDAVHLRRRKAAIDEARQRYKDLYNDNHFAEDSAELARLAETLGRRFEAIGFLTWITRREPFNQDARAALARLKGVQTGSSMPGPGRNVTQLLSADLAGERAGSSAQTQPQHPGPLPLQFRDDAAAAHLSFVYENGESSIHQLPETMCGGIGLIDYDGDGWLDVYAVQGGPFPPGNTASQCPRRPSLPESARRHLPGRDTRHRPGGHD